MNEDLPKIITYNSASPFDGKFVGINEKENLSIFPVNRIYWINYSAAYATQSQHAHKSLKQIIIAVDGVIGISLQNLSGKSFEFVLNNPGEGLYIPPLYWKKLDYSSPCILLCLASETYNENDYIRSYDEFKTLKKQ
jgi:hypothetical protein